MKIYYHWFRTPFGYFRLSATERGLYAIDFAKKARADTAKGIPKKVSALLKESASRLSAYFSGKKVSFRRLPVDWDGHTPFQQKVLEALRKIPAGRVASYQFLACQAGRPQAQRGVGQILRRNRLPFFIPCHRIIRKDGRLGGFAKGLVWKKRLLKLEGASVDRLDE